MRCFGRAISEGSLQVYVSALPYYSLESCLRRLYNEFGDLSPKFHLIATASGATLRGACELEDLHSPSKWKETHSSPVQSPERLEYFE